MDTRREFGCGDWDVSWHTIVSTVAHEKRFVELEKEHSAGVIDRYNTTTKTRFKVHCVPPYVVVYVFGHGVGSCRGVRYKRPEDEWEGHA